MPVQVVDGRRAAIDAVAEWLSGERDRLPERWDHVATADRALARELAAGAVRYVTLYEALADGFLRGDRRPPRLLATLAVAAHQLFALERIPRHAVGHATVEALRRLGGARLCGVANAVIRRLADLQVAVDPTAPPGPLRRIARRAWPSSLALRHALPEALIADLPAEDQRDDRALAALSVVPDLCTRLRPGVELPSSLRPLAREGNWAWWGDPVTVIRELVVPGLAVVQDRHQGLAIELAQPRPGELAIDACAAPGGKAGYLRDLGARVLAGDRAPAKMARLRSALGVPTFVADGRVPPFASGSADLVVVDAPCSNSGVFGRHPEAKARYTPAAIGELVAIQRGLLTAACRMAGGRGRVLYATCSVGSPENDGVVAAVTERTGWRLVDERRSWPGPRGGGGYAALIRPPAATA